MIITLNFDCDNYIENDQITIAASLNANAPCLSGHFTTLFNKEKIYNYHFI